MLKFYYTKQHYEAATRLRENRRRAYNIYQVSNTDYSPTTDQLILFTLGENPRIESKENLTFLLDTIRSSTAQADFLICSNNKIQVLGSNLPTALLTSLIAPDSWIKETALTCMNDKSWRRFNLTRQEHATPTGHLITLSQHAVQFFMPEDLGVYSLQTGKKIKQRRDVIDKIYEYGFICRRGRPLTVAIPDHSGYRTDVEMLTRLLQGQRSSVTHGYKLIFNKIRRTSAWPGYY